MSSIDRGGLKAAFAGFKRPEHEREAEIRLLGRAVESEDASAAPESDSEAQSAISAVSPITAAVQNVVAPPQTPVTIVHNSTGTIVAGVTSNLTPRPLLHREAVRQLSFRCPVSLATELRRKASFNQLEQQEIIIEGLRRVLAELEMPPEGWQEP
jgi:hypothetical protein